MSNYPEGVSDSHPHFNPPREIASAVECGNDEALVVPSFGVKAALNEIADLLERIPTGTMAYAPSPAAARKAALNVVKRLQGEISEWEQEREYECPFSGEVDLEESECARWDCLVCGAERETDTMPEERDPDYEYDHRGEGR